MKKAKRPTKREFSAGGVVFRKRKTGQIEWLICRHSGYHQWILPRGLIEKGEKSEETAQREVEEECGVKARVIAKIKEPEKYIYQFKGTLIFKNVVYFLMEYLSGKTENHDWEVEELAWLSYEQALKELKFKGAKKVLIAAQKLLKARENSHH
jgi:bis(5'-nucleosidyl)-tetraphosphatase